jgi:hypothetical protein
MARQKQHSKRRRSQKRSSRKMKGGLVETDRQILNSLGFADDQITYLFTNHPDMMIEFFQNSINPPANNPFYTEAQTPDQIIESLRENNEDDNSEGHTTAEIETDDSLNNAGLDISMISNNNLNNSELDISSISGNTNNTLSDELGNASFGGKRKSKKRTTKKKNIKKTRKTRKTKKHRKRHQRGGAMTTSVDTVLDNDEQEYIDYKKLMAKQ